MPKKLDDLMNTASATALLMRGPRHPAEAPRYGALYYPDDPAPVADPAPAPAADPAPADPAPDPAPAPTPTWPENWRVQASGGDEKLAKRLERFSAPTDLATAYAEADAAINSRRFGDKIALPGKDATPEDVAAFHQALPEDLRRPETVEDYKIDHPEFAFGGAESFDEPTQERINGVVAKMHEAGASNTLVQTMFDAYWGLAQADAEAIQAADKRYLEESETALRKEWGQDYDENNGFADRALTSIFGKDFPDMELKGGQTLSKVPEFRKAMAMIGRLIGDDDGTIGITDPAAQQSLQEKIDEITAQAWKDGNYYTDPVQKKLHPLYDKLHGTAVADGRAAA